MKTNLVKNIIFVVILLPCCLLGVWGIYINECKIIFLTDFYGAINNWEFDFTEFDFTKKTDTLLRISIDSKTIKLYFKNRIEIYNLKN